MCSCKCSGRFLLLSLITAADSGGALCCGHWVLVHAAHGSYPALPMHQVSLAIVKACLWRDHHADQRHTTSAQTAASTGKITAQLNRSLAAMHLTRDAQASSTAGSRRAGGEGAVGRLS